MQTSLLQALNLEHSELVLFMYPATAAVWERKVADTQLQCRIYKDCILDQNFLTQIDTTLKPDLTRTYFSKTYLQ